MINQHLQDTLNNLVRDFTKVRPEPLTKSEVREGLNSLIAKIREEVGNKFDTEMKGVREMGTLTPTGETIMKVLGEIKLDLLEMFNPTKPK